MKALPFLLPLSLLIASPTSGQALSHQQAQQAADRIDSLLNADLQKAHLKPNGLIDNATFLRRAYLGIIGRIPTEDEARRFYEEGSADKRARLVEELAASPGFDSHLFNWAGDLLRLQTRQEQFGLGWHVWLRQSLAEDKPWNQTVGEMLSATGHAASNPAVGYYLRDRNMQLDNFSNTMQVFLGRQIGCAQCHDHPFDEWTQYEYYQMAAFGGGFTYRSQDVANTIKRVGSDLHGSEGKGNFKGRKTAAQAKNKQREAQNRNRKLGNQLRPVFKDFNKNAIFDNPKQQLFLPEDYQYNDAQPKEVVDPETLFGTHLENVAPEDRRQAFAAWVTADDNPYFTKVIVNRLWARTFGHGLHDPIDDWSSDSEPAHPEVLAHLETIMKDVGYDLRQFLRVLYLTKLFQRECESEEPALGVPHLVRGPALQRMSAEQLYDSFLVLTHGDVDDTQLKSHASKWTAYREQVANLLNADSRDLMRRAESTRQAEQEFRDAQAKVREAQKQLASAKTQAERKQLQAAYQEARNEQSEARMQREPLSMMNMMGQGMQKRDKGFIARASEQPAPFNPSTLVREFGGSDRETPSSSNTTATVPQALALLNDPKTDIAANRKSPLGKRLLQLDSPKERLETIFLTLYSREPSSAEIERFTPLAANPETLRDLTRAMLTSNQFIFIQ
ncbi:DUF1549 domain-containing protein [Haloferula chungangensis]|uniref:DUF1549 domain-containing protein n=1 Tax=Haloferula chungangensis TaxID=1048331 RepID=A0ABW2L4L0_9BACT